MSETAGLEQFQRLFTAFERSAWRWECQGIYREPEEKEPLRKFLAGEPPDDGWRVDFLELVASATAAGKSFARVRQLTKPLTDYLRFEMDLAVSGNIPAGEDIRVIWPDEVGPADAADHDFWIFDDNTVATMQFDGNGLSGVEILTGVAVAPYCQWKRWACDHSHPFETYTSALH